MKLPGFQAAAADLVGKAGEGLDRAGKGPGKAAGEQDGDQNRRQNDDQQHPVDLPRKGRDGGHVHVDQQIGIGGIGVAQGGDGVYPALERDKLVLHALVEPAADKVVRQLPADHIIPVQHRKQLPVLTQDQSVGPGAGDPIRRLVEAPGLHVPMGTLLAEGKGAGRDGLQLRRHPRAHVAAHGEIEGQDHRQQYPAGQTDQGQQHMALDMPRPSHAFSSRRKP